MLLTGCGSAAKEESEQSQTAQEETVRTVVPAISRTEDPEYIKSLNYQSLSDPEMMRFVEDAVYSDLVSQLNSDEYFVEDVQTTYISKEYLEELEYNSQENIYFGYKLSDLNEQFQGKRYIFTLGDNGQTVVQEFEEYDDTFNRVVKNVAIGTGVILICVTVSAVSGGLGAPAVSMIFAASAKSATVFALSSGAISGASAGIIEGFRTRDFDKALKAAADQGSEGFKCGAIMGAVTGGATEAIALHGATLNGLTMNEAAQIQKESKYPLDVIKQFKSMDQYNICKEAGLTPDMINGKTALIRDIDLDFVADKANGKTNLQLMQGGNAPYDPAGNTFELHHIGQKNDSTLAILTQEEHRLGGNHSIWHDLIKESEIDRNAFNKIRADFWKDYAQMVAA